MPRPPHFDVAVLGVGTMGSMALWRLAERGAHVIGLERFGIGHERGAAGGETRIFRTAYKEGRQYVPLLQHSQRLWSDLQADATEELLRPTGALTIGAVDHPDVQEVLASGDDHDLGLEVLDAEQAAWRFPQHRLLDAEVAILDRTGGLLRPGLAITAAVEAARRHGAQMRTHTRVLRLDAGADGVCVELDDGVVTADKAIVSLGPWTRDLLPDVGRRFEVRRSVLHWFEVDDPTAFAPEVFPVGLRRSGPSGNLSFFPCLDNRTIKVNFHVPKESVADPEEFDGEISAAYSRQVADGVVPLFNGLRELPVRAAGYMEGYSPDNHGLVGAAPGNECVTVLAGFSGHGFKLAPAVGDIAADLVMTGSTAHPISHMSLSRPTGASRAGRTPSRSTST